MICHDGGETRYFMALIRLKFPLYGEDHQLRFPAFIISELKSDDTFSFCLSALMKSGFDPNKENDDDESFL